MRLFYYVHTGHRIGLDRFRRAATIIRALGDVDITLLTSDFRIASAAKAYGIRRAVGVDVVRNIPQIAHHGDKIIFDSAELNPVMHDDMTRFFSTFIRVSDDPGERKHPGELLISPYLEGEGICNAVAIDETYFDARPKTIERAFFFGDDDYEEDLAARQKAFSGLGLELLQGFYWFYGYEKKLADTFGKMYDEEAYDEVIRQSRILLTASAQAALEHLAGGGKPVYFQREDYPKDYQALFKRLNVPTVSSYDNVRLSSVLSEIESQKYHACPKNIDKLTTFLKENLDL